eukprot:gene6680-13531_t
MFWVRYIAQNPKLVIVVIYIQSRHLRIVVLEILSVLMFAVLSSLLHGNKMGKFIRKASTVSVPINVKDVLKRCNAVCFDVDSTVIRDEGIDVLADFKGAGEAVAAWTKKAMGGQVLFQDALAARLDLIKPSRLDIAACLAKHPPRLTDNVKNVIDKLHQKGIHVYLVSGGFRLMINPVAEILKIPLHRIYANTLQFHNDESFKGFDSTEPTSRDGGKPYVIQKLKDEHGYQSVIMIGDGATDMQAKPPADAFIGFGGIIIRENVRAGADWFITDFKELLAALE